uniref:TNRC6 PABC binding domain-containing protein n=1 Tax=Cyclopterus lumpus TaxID=8103 RepID=A0A8C2WI03_CYCLU
GPVTPMKMPGGSPYSQYDMMVGDGLGDNWHRTPGTKMGTKPTTTPSWPPEFQPGVPWKGIDRVDPDSDPYMTPGSMMGNAVSPNLNDTEHQLLQDNTDSTPPLNTMLPSPGAWPYSASDSPLNNAHNSVKYTDYKTSWPPEPIGHKSWKATRGSSQSQLSRPPPGLASQKQPSPSPWSGGAPRLAGRGWGGGSSTAGNAPTHFSCFVPKGCFLSSRRSACGNIHLILEQQSLIAEIQQDISDLEVLSNLGGSNRERYSLFMTSEKPRGKKRVRLCLRGMRKTLI